MTPSLDGSLVPPETYPPSKAFASLLPGGTPLRTIRYVCVPDNVHSFSGCWGGEWRRYGRFSSNVLEPVYGKAVDHDSYV